MPILEEKVAIITGGGSGIGRETAKLLAREGAQLVVADFDLDVAGEAVAQIEKNGGTAIAVLCDVREEYQVSAMVSEAVEVYGRIDILLNSAGGGRSTDGSVTDMDLETFWRTIRVDLFGTVLSCRYVIPQMVRAGGGSIINMSSMRAVMGTQGADAYTAAKGGVLALSRALAMQWADHNIRVNTLAPGMVMTDRIRAMVDDDHPLVRKMLLGPCEASDVAELVLYLASDASRKMTGEVFRLDGGATTY